MFYCHFLISSAYVRSILFLDFFVLIFAWNVPPSLHEMVSLIFLKRSLVFPILLFSSISLHRSLRRAFLSLLAIPWISAFRLEIFSFLLCLYLLLFSQLFVRPSETAILPFYIFGGMVLITASGTVSQTSVHSSSGILFIRSNPLNLFVDSTV